VEKIWSVEASKILAENPIAMRSYQRLQSQGTDVIYVNDPGMKEMGLFDQYSNTVTINMLRHSSAKEAVSTIVHEAKHQHRFYRTGEAGTVYEEYLAFRNESLFTTGVRPSQAERMNIYNDVKQLYKDKDLPLGQYPFGGKR
jgi:predicted transcriptional regulator